MPDAAAIDVSGYHLEQTVTIAAPPERVHALVADITRMGEWSPVNTGGEWDDDTHTWFRGRNETPERTWETRCRVDANEPGKEFTFINCSDGSGDYVRWSYTFAPSAAGTEVTESWQLLPDYPGMLSRRFEVVDIPAVLDERLATAKTGIATTLANLKQAAEAS